MRNEPMHEEDSQEAQERRLEEIARRREARAEPIRGIAANARDLMGPIFEAMNGPQVAASFGNQPGTVKLYDTATPRGIDALYTAAERAAKMRQSSFLNLGNWDNIKPNRKGNITLGEKTAEPYADWYTCWADIDVSKGEVNWPLLKKLTRQGCAVFRSPSGGKNVHVWWFFRSPMTMDEVRDRNRRIKHALNADDKEHPVSFLRLPYAPSFKDKHKGRSLTLKSFNDRPWSAATFDALLASEGFTAPERARTNTHAQVSVKALRKPARGLVTGALRTGITNAIAANAADRSAAAWAITKEVARAGKSIEECAGILAYHKLCEDVRETYEGSDERLTEDVERMWPKALAEVTTEKAGVVDEHEEELIVESAAGTFRRTRWLIPNWIPIGELTLMAGFEGLNKSTYCIWLSSQVTRGAIKGGEWEGRPRGVLYLASEDSWESTIMPRLEAAGADRSRVFRLRLPTSKRGTVDMTRYLAQVKAAVVKYDIGLIVFDPIAAVLLNAKNQDAEDGLRKALDPIIDMAEETQVAMIGLKHFTKLESADPAKLMGGNRAWSMIARSTIMVARDPEEEGRVVIGVHKNNLAAPTPALHYRPEIVELEAEGVMVGHPRIRWDEGFSSFTPQSALAANLAKERAASSPERASKKASAKEWLIGYLKEKGATSRNVVHQDGLEEGYATRTLDRAWADLRLERLTGKKTDPQGYPLWCLKGR